MRMTPFDVKAKAITTHPVVSLVTVDLTTNRYQEAVEGKVPRPHLQLDPSPVARARHKQTLISIQLSKDSTNPAPTCLPFGTALRLKPITLESCSLGWSGSSVDASNPLERT